MLESALVDVLHTKMIYLSDAERDALFFIRNAPLGSLSTKISMAYALGLINKNQRLAADRVRAIRNVFAHSVRPITFKEPLVSAECMKLPPMVSKETEVKGHISLERALYTMVSFQLMRELNDVVRRHLRKAMRRASRRKS
jgi:DNA-binding MltR family transcriptional regulator